MRLERRVAEVGRKTVETDIRVRIDLDGTGVSSVDSGVVFFDHMLSSFARHGVVDLSVRNGSRTSDEHHVVEDVAIVLGEAVDRALGDKRGIRRFGYALVPMDEALAMVVVDVSGRGYLSGDIRFRGSRIGGMSSDLIVHFFEAFAINAKMTVHSKFLSGRNDHHKAEALFKALGVAFGMAVQVDPRRRGSIPSEKGVI